MLTITDEEYKDLEESLDLTFEDDSWHTMRTDWLFDALTFYKQHQATTEEPLSGVLHIQLVKHYGIEDTGYVGDYDTELVVDGKSILQGDEYHDKIDNQIRGFYAALGMLGIKYKRDKTVKIADADHW